MSEEFQDCLCLKCIECGKLFHGLNSFKKHLYEEHKSIKYINCKLCGKLFNGSNDYNQHIKVHNMESNSILCEKCGKTFHRIDIFNTHLNTCTPIYFQCPLCAVKATKEGLLNHFVSHHKIQMDTETKSFSSFDDFETWKNQYEKENMLNYAEEVTHSGAEGSLFYKYSCCCRGHFQSDESHNKNIELITSNKINELCPSIIRANVSKEGNVSVFIIKTHVGHTNLGTLQQTKDNNLNKVTGENWNKTVCEVKDSVSNKGSLKKNTESIHKKHDLLDKLVSGKNSKCIKKIDKKRPQLKTVKQNHKSLLGQSVESWVLNRTNKECVKFFKPQRSVSPKYPQLEFDRYFLLIMSKSQTDLLKKFSQKFICIDRQSGETFDLVVLLVLDDKDQSFPCAFLFTNKTDQSVMEVFFNEIKTNVGTIHTKLFMSGKAKFVCNAWNQVMGPSEKNLFCSWDILKDWKLNMCMMSNKEKQGSTYKALKSLLEETDINIFTTKYQLILSKLQSDTDTADFASYLATNYSGTLNTWGCCFRSSEGIPVNFQLEKMHSVFKHILQAKCTKRIDKAVSAVLDFLRNKVYDRLMLLSDGKVPSKLSDMYHRHKIAEKLTYDVKKNADYWCVVSRKKEQNIVTVANSECKCNFKCTDCNVCAHVYRCTCLDSTLKLNMCRHIHYICMMEASVNVTECANDSLDPSNINETSGNIVISISDDVINKSCDNVTVCTSNSNVTSDSANEGYRNLTVCPDIIMASDNISFTNKGLPNYKLLDVKQKVLIVDKTKPNEITELLFDTVYEFDPKLSVVKSDSNSEIEYVYCNESIEGATCEQSTQNLAETIESRKVEVENLFKTTLNGVQCEEQMEEVEKAINTLQCKVKTLNSQNDEHAKKRVHEQVNEKHTMENVELQNKQNPVKKPRN